MYFTDMTEQDWNYVNGTTNEIYYVINFTSIMNPEERNYLFDVFEKKHSQHNYYITTLMFRVVERLFKTLNNKNKNKLLRQLEKEYLKEI